MNNSLYFDTSTIFITNLSLKKKALPKKFVFLLAQVFFFSKKEKVS